MSVSAGRNRNFATEDFATEQKALAHAATFVGVDGVGLSCRVAGT
jgi:hypothetical protein